MAAVAPTARWPLLTLLAAVAASQASARSASLRVESRRLFYAPLEENYVWGKCDAWTEGTMGCNLTDSLVCSSHYSDGPEDGDVEIELWNLPNSTDEEEVHLQWWAPRKSDYWYNPWQSPHGCAVYYDMRKAYPLYNESDYNGGNVRVNASGVAVIKVHQPSTYRVDQWILFPHIHFRFCKGTHFVSAASDTIFFTNDGLRLVQGFHGHSHLMEDFLPGPDETYTTTSTARIDLTKGDPPPNKDLIDNTSGLVDLRVTDALDALDLDALEFSPVYHCLLEEKFYSYSSGGCVDECPSDTEVHIGQCVRKEKDGEPVILKATWLLKMECVSTCFHDKLKVTLHHIRLAVADHLDIPFQEVTEVSLSKVTINKRRLSDREVHAAKLRITVESKRVWPGVDGPYLSSLLKTASDASFFLGFEVTDVKLVSSDEDDDAEDEESIETLNRDNDPYEDAYKREAGSEGGVRIPGVASDTIPVEVVFIGAGAVLLTFCAFAACIAVRRRRNGQPLVVAGYVVAGPTGTPVAPPKTVGNPMEEDDYPQKPGDPPSKPQPAAGLGTALPPAAGLGAAPPPSPAAQDLLKAKKWNEGAALAMASAAAAAKRNEEETQPAAITMGSSDVEEETHNNITEAVGSAQV